MLEVFNKLVRRVRTISLMVGRFNKFFFWGGERIYKGFSQRCGEVFSWLCFSLGFSKVFKV